MINVMRVCLNHAHPHGFYAVDCLLMAERIDQLRIAVIS